MLRGSEAFLVRLQPSETLKESEHTKSLLPRPSLATEKLRESGSG